jgi:hypothetical protein
LMFCAHAEQRLREWFAVRYKNREVRNGQGVDSLSLRNTPLRFDSVPPSL